MCRIHSHMLQLAAGHYRGNYSQLAFNLQPCFCDSLSRAAFPSLISILHCNIKNPIDIKVIL
jgi:hypothetical protein